MLNLIKQHLCIVVLCFFTFTWAQEFPPISNYETDDYGAESQNWDITQTDDKVMFFANNAGLLEFNGSRWNLYKNPNESIMRSVKAVGQRVYSGCYMDLGFWERGQDGTMHYSSLLPGLNFPVIEDEEFWTIDQLQKWILFQSLNRILIYDTEEGTFSEISSESIITNMFLVNETIYFQRQGVGVFKIEESQDILVSSDAIFRSSVIVNMFAAEQGLKIVTQNNGSFLLNENKVVPLDKSTTFSSSNTSVYSAIQLETGDLVYGSISNGLFQLKQDFSFDMQINQASGLGNNTILSVFQDLDQNIWLGYDNGIGCINNNSALKIYRDTKGQLGSVYTSSVYNNKLFLGTNQGLFYKSLNSRGAFSFVEGSQGQVWSLFNHDDKLFIGHNLGTFTFENNKLTRIADQQGTWVLKKVPNDSNVLLQGNYEGIYILEKNQDQWKLRNKLQGFNISSRFLEIIDNQIFVNHEYKGVFVISIDNSLTKAIDVKVDTSKQGSNSGLAKYDNKILFANRNGIYKYNKTESTFLRDTLFSKMYTDNDYSSGRLIVDNKNRRIWNFSASSVNIMSSGLVSDKPLLTKLPLTQSLRHSVSNYENVLQLRDKQYLLGTRFGYITVDLDKLTLKPESIRIDKLVAYSFTENTSKTVNLGEDIKIPYKDHNVEFYFSVPEYDRYLSTVYQYRLDGIYDNWSEWTTSSTKLFENLPYGNYTFKVRAKEGESLQTDIASFSFTINRPWYISNLMLIVYVFGAILAAFLIHKVYTTYYRRQRQQILEKAQKDLELKELENEQERMKFKNQKLKQDIESKSRELAASTMSLIKKNEFLSSIKNKLRKEEDKRSIKDIIKVIDNNLNSTDDWKLFEEAFNNADKGFLKKVKKRHQGLTPNDLRLCAYLRLNLSSKEIAPLLNISPRSVEVKRYRLRKKMNLEHETSLANYIINL